MSAWNLERVDRIQVAAHALSSLLVSKLYRVTRAAFTGDLRNFGANSSVIFLRVPYERIRQAEGKLTPIENHGRMNIERRHDDRKPFFLPAILDRPSAGFNPYSLGLPRFEKFDFHACD